MGFSIKNLSLTAKIIIGTILVGGVTTAVTVPLVINEQNKNNSICHVSYSDSSSKVAYIGVVYDKKDNDYKSTITAKNSDEIISSITILDNTSELVLNKDYSFLSNTLTIFKNVFDNYSGNLLVDIETSSKTISVSGIKISQNSLSMAVGEKVKLSAEVIPSNATNKTIDWISSSPEIALVDSLGNIVSCSPGNTTIKAISRDSHFEATCTVKVYSKDIKVEGIVLNASSLELEKDTKTTLIATILPSTSTHKEVNWSSSFPNVASVNQNGEVICNNVGTTTIYAKTQDPSISEQYVATCEISVYQSSSYIHVSSVSLDLNHISLLTGENFTLNATVLPEEATFKDVEWTSSNPEVASVDFNGKVIGLTAGKALINVTTRDGGYTAQCAVDVSDSYIPVRSISLNTTYLNLSAKSEEERTATLQAYIYPENATNKEKKWTSSDPYNISVDENGIVTLLNDNFIGQATITVRANIYDGNIFATCDVKVSHEEIHVQSISLTPKELVFSLDESGSLIYSEVLPSNASNKEVRWTSSNPSVAIVNENGFVTPLGLGSAAIICTAVDGGIYGSSFVQVLKDKKLNGIKINGKQNVDIDDTSTHHFSATDYNNNPVEVIWKIAGSIGKIDQNGTFLPNDFGKYDGGTAKIFAYYKYDTSIYGSINIYLASFSKIKLENNVVSKKDDYISGHVALPICYAGESKIETVDTIKAEGFKKCVSLNSISIPDNIIYIHKYAFSDCTTLSYNEDSYNNLYLGSLLSPFHAIFKYKNFASLTFTLSSDTKVIAPYVFYNNNDLFKLGVKEIKFSPNLVSINEYAFYKQSELESVSFEASNNFIEVGDSAFENCSNLVFFHYPNNPVSGNYLKFGNFAFKDCINLNASPDYSFSIPEFVSSIGTGAFYGCKISIFKVSENNKRFAFTQNGLYSCEVQGEKSVPTILLSYFYNFNKEQESPKFPDTIKKINDYAFSNCNALFKTLDCGDILSLTEIGNYAFYGTKIESITLPKTVSFIGDHAFEDCTSLKTFIFLGYLTPPLKEISYIGNYAFKNTAIQSIRLSNDLTFIGIDAFTSSNADAFKEINLVGYDLIWRANDEFNTFHNLSLLKDYPEFTAKFFKENHDVSFSTYSPTNEGIIYNKIYGSGGIISYSMEQDKDSSCPNIITSYDSITDYETSETGEVTRIEDEGFANNHSFTTFITSKNLKYLGAESFKNCVHLKTMNCRGDFKFIYRNTFLGCSSLTQVTFPSSISKIDLDAFKGTNLEYAYFEVDSGDIWSLVDASGKVISQKFCPHKDAYESAFFLRAGYCFIRTS